MSFSWQSMRDDDFAAFQQLMGSKILKVGGIYWTEVRPFFYRPLWPFQECHPDSVIVPRMTARLGAMQYAVASAEHANSYLNLFVLEQASAYTLDQLPRKPRKQVRLAARDFVIRPITDVSEFKLQALPIYRSFHERTRYEVGARRQDPVYFARWADALYRNPDVLILGGYRQGELGGISLSFRIGDTLDYASFFCNAWALELHLSDLMLHSIRESAAACTGINRIYLGMFKNNRGLDDFKVLRGATLVHQRARLEVNPVTRMLLQRFLPEQYAQLLGHLPEHQNKSSSSGTTAVTKAMPDQASTAQISQPPN